jgi:hypothetical protein
MTLIFGKSIDTFNYRMGENFTFSINKEQGFTSITTSDKKTIGNVSINAPLKETTNDK